MDINNAKNTYPKNFVIMDTEDERDILLRIFSDMRITMREMTVQSAIDEVLEAKKIHTDTHIDDIYRMNNEYSKSEGHRLLWR